MKIIQQFRNARAVILQIRAGEWLPVYNPIAGRSLIARRGGLALWIGNGAWFCDMYESPHAFGLVWRHYVWWAAARRLKTEADLPDLSRPQGETL